MAKDTGLDYRVTALGEILGYRSNVKDAVRLAKTMANKLGTTTYIEEWRLVETVKPNQPKAK